MKKYLLSISLLINLAFLALVIRHFILLPKKVIGQSVSYFVSRDKVLAGLPKNTSDILFVGDSEIQGYDVAEYFHSLQAKNRGIYYDTSLGVLHRTFDIAKGKPAKVFIEIGLNDLQRGVAADSIYVNLRKTIDIILKNSPKTKIYLLSIIPSTLIKEAQRLALNTLYSQQRSASVTFVDLDTFLLENEGLAKRYDVGDKIHLNAAGYLELTKILRPYVED
jgi:lysophospholipase L1-like esterase